MKYLTRAFVATAVFAAIACVAYAIVTREPFGIVALGLWSVSVWIVAGWLLYQRRSGRTVLASDVEDADAAATAGEATGDFRLQSSWPVWVALGAATVGIGLVWSLWITAVGALVLLYGLQRAVRD